jgi:serine/threonine-protein kinase RsbW
VSAKRQVLTLRNDINELTRLVEFVDAFCDPLHLSESDRLALHLALEEAVTNVIVHGYKVPGAQSFSVSLDLDAETRLTAVVIDDAPAYDPLARAPVDITLPLAEREIGGLGIQLVKKMMDVAKYERRDGRNILTLERTVRRTT